MPLISFTCPLPTLPGPGHWTPGICQRLIMLANPVSICMCADGITF